LVESGAQFAQGFNNGVTYGSMLDEPATGVTDWDSLEGCPGAEAVGKVAVWVRVDDFPAEQVDYAGIVVECGNSYVDEADGDNFVSAMAVVTAGDVFILGARLVADGYVLGWDDFQAPEDPSDGYAGARDYSSADGQSTFTIEAYDNGTDPESFTVYFDYTSAETRALKSSDPS
jgi:hypothetical protein